MVRLFTAVVATAVFCSVQGQDFDVQSANSVTFGDENGNNDVDRALLDNYVTNEENYVEGIEVNYKGGSRSSRNRRTTSRRTSSRRTSSRRRSSRRTSSRRTSSRRRSSRRSVRRRPSRARARRRKTAAKGRRRRVRRRPSRARARRRKTAAKGRRRRVRRKPSRARARRRKTAAKGRRRRVRRRPSRARARRRKTAAKGRRRRVRRRPSRARARRRKTAAKGRRRRVRRKPSRARARRRKTAAKGRRRSVRRRPSRGRLPRRVSSKGRRARVYGVAAIVTRRAVEPNNRRAGRIPFSTIRYIPPQGSVVLKPKVVGPTVVPVARKPVSQVPADMEWTFLDAKKISTAGCRGRGCRAQRRKAQQEERKAFLAYVAAKNPKFTKSKWEKTAKSVTGLISGAVVGTAVGAVTSGLGGYAAGAVTSEISNKVWDEISRSRKMRKYKEEWKALGRPYPKFTPTKDPVPPKHTSRAWRRKNPNKVPPKSLAALAKQGWKETKMWYSKTEKKALEVKNALFTPDAKPPAGLTRKERRTWKREQEKAKKETYERFVKYQAAKQEVLGTSLAQSAMEKTLGAAGDRAAARVSRFVKGNIVVEAVLTTAGSWAAEKIGKTIGKRWDKQEAFREWQKAGEPSFTISQADAAKVVEAKQKKAGTDRRSRRSRRAESNFVEDDFELEEAVVHHYTDSELAEDMDSDLALADFNPTDDYDDYDEYEVDATQAAPRELPANVQGLLVIAGISIDDWKAKLADHLTIFRTSLALGLTKAGAAPRGKWVIPADVVGIKCVGVGSEKVSCGFFVKTRSFAASLRMETAVANLMKSGVFNFLMDRVASFGHVKDLERTESFGESTIYAVGKATIDTSPQVYKPFMCPTGQVLLNGKCVATEDTPCGCKA